MFPIVLRDPVRQRWFGEPAGRRLLNSSLGETRRGGILNERRRTWPEQEEKAQREERMPAGWCAAVSHDRKLGNWQAMWPLLFFPCAELCAPERSASHQTI
jgi:hypothetical protein